MLFVHSCVGCVSSIWLSEPITNCVSQKVLMVKWKKKIRLTSNYGQTAKYHRQKLWKEYTQAIPSEVSVISWILYQIGKNRRVWNNGHKILSYGHVLFYQLVSVFEIWSYVSSSTSIIKELENHIIFIHCYFFLFSFYCHRFRQMFILFT